MTTAPGQTDQSTAPDESLTQYVVLIFEHETPDWPNDIPPEIAEASERFDGWVGEQGGRVVAGVALQPTATATAIRGDMVTDGPFIETKEALAGLYVLEARDLDHAIALARRTPIVNGGIEVRPLLDFQVTEGG